MDGSLLLDPFLLAVLGGVVLLLGWRLSGFRRKRVRKELSRLRSQARQETNPRKRQELLQRWKELGGQQVTQRLHSERMALDEGQKARTAGRPLSANPYGTRLWGRGRLWRRGWKSVDKHIRWIQSHRQ